MVQSLILSRFVVRKAAIITTGNEVYHGRIQDAFTPVIAKKKIAEFGAQMMFHEVFDDDDKKNHRRMLTRDRSRSGNCILHRWNERGS